MWTTKQKGKYQNAPVDAIASITDLTSSSANLGSGTAALNNLQQIGRESATLEKFVASMPPKRPKESTLRDPLRNSEEKQLLGGAAEDRDRPEAGAYYLPVVREVSDSMSIIELVIGGIRRMLLGVDFRRHSLLRSRRCMDRRKSRRQKSPTWS